MYQTEFEGQHYELGTSGFLYRSNKLMYDAKTKSLWSTLQGEPVVGPLVGKGIKLKRHSLVTTTWGEWRQRHPDTTVLPIKTGYERDYSEGAAYKDYFGSQKLMFTVPRDDDRLQNKDQVLALQNESGQLAISANFLMNHKVYQTKLGDTELVVLTDGSGANRVYQTNGETFFWWNESSAIIDEQDQRWIVTEQQLIAPDGVQSLRRFPAHRAFWFGWHSQYPDTELTK